MKVRVEASGIEQVKASIRALGPIGQQIAKRVIEEETLAMLVPIKADTPVEPEDGGQLRASVRISRPTVTKAGRVSGGVVAGGSPLNKVLGKRKANVYAVVQHEDTTLKHNVGGSHFVAKTFLKRAMQFPQKLLAALDRGMKARQSVSGDFDTMGGS